MLNSKYSQLNTFRAQEDADRKARLADEAIEAASAITAQAALDAHNKKPASFTFTPSAGSYHYQPLDAGVMKHSLAVDVRTLVAAIEDWKDVNPRSISTLDNHVKNGILQTLRDEPSKMITRNMGLTLTAKSVTVDADTGAVTVKLTDKTIHGLLNGGHTTHWILQVIEEQRKAGTLASWVAYVPMTVYVGFKTKEEVAEVSDPLNTNVAVKRSMSAHMRGKYDILINALKDKHYANEIAFKGKSGKIAVNDVFRILIAFDKFNYPDGKSNPIRVDLETSKKGKGSFTAILDEQHDADFLPELDSTGNVKKHRNSMKMLFENADTFLRLRDTLTRDLLENHEKLIRFVVSGGKSPKCILDGNKKKLMFLGDADTPVMVGGQQWKGWILPIVGAFRANVEWDSVNETIGWTIPNSVLMKKAMPEMLKFLIARHKEKDCNPANLLRDTDTYVALYAICEKHVTALAPKYAKV